MADKITTFIVGDKSVPVAYTETQQVKEGVECDIYTFTDDPSRDLAVVRVKQGYKTPLQRVVKGTDTTEGWLSGLGSLMVRTGENTEIYQFDAHSVVSEVIVEVGQIMQWTAHEDLCFYEICEPPYEDGRFEDLPE